MTYLVKVGKTVYSPFPSFKRSLPELPHGVFHIELIVLKAKTNVVYPLDVGVQLKLP